ncbi:RNA polymerase sigma factor [Ammoniphilus resinae]|uniref:RNA polymerase sigma factor n=1 Tax=Ammoniphilus resinae TaxID=861532 RepID=A0ABS4GP13_9BACL|nr:sigma-70 family RNA polymerase sigma factor [Ammoniphilus resinae]MBP1932010.1 RNA polymerase sigma-70 factor (ECF subfamily) [Ammoniphilus resinae]
MLKGFLGKQSEKDEQFQRILFEMFYQRIYRIAYFITHDQDLAQDVVQETFIKAFKNLYHLEDGNKMAAWLGTIATRTAIDFLRKEKRWNDFTTEDVYIDNQVKNQTISSVERKVENRFIRELLRGEIMILKPEFKQVIILRYEYEMTYEEMASALEITVGTVKARLHRAKLKLKSSLKQHPAIQDGDIVR